VQNSRLQLEVCHEEQGQQVVQMHLIGLCLPQKLWQWLPW